MYKVEKENGLYYIFKKKRFLFWSNWVKVPGSGLGWGVKSMAFIEGFKSESVAIEIEKLYYDSDMYNYKENAKEKGIDLKEYYFDQEAAQKVVTFIESFCSHVKGELMKKPFILEEWQKNDIIYPLFGWKRREDNTRKYRTCYIELPRKNGKTTLIGALSLYLLCADGEPGAEIYSAAGDKSQAKIMHEIAKQMIAQNSTLTKKTKVLTNSITYQKTNSFYQAISSESKTKHGFNAHAILFDELHVQKNRELWDTLTTSIGSRRQPLVIAITTAGNDKQSLCYQKHTYAKKVSEGIIKDPSFLGVIYSAANDADIEQPETWKKANPGYGSSCKPSFFKDELRKIKEDPGYKDTFKRLCLNIWGETFKTWIDDKDFVKSAGEVDKEALKGASAIAGLDLASVSDFTAFTLHFHENDNEEIKALYWFWIPEQRYNQRKKDLIDVIKWRESGALKVTPGNVIDYDIIIEDIIKINQDYRIEIIAYDPWGGERVAANLQDVGGIEVSKYSQLISYMAPPTKELQRLILSKKYNHGNNPVFRWMMSNITIYTDANNNFKIHKGKSGENVDGPVSAVTALGQYMADSASMGGSIYDSQKLDYI